LVGRLGGLQSRSGRGGEEEKSHHCPCKKSNPGLPARRIVTILTELPGCSFTLRKRENNRKERKKKRKMKKEGMR
jgi:hypothetical protein